MSRQDDLFCAEERLPLLTRLRRWLRRGRTEIYWVDVPAPAMDLDTFSIRVELGGSYYDALGGFLVFRAPLRMESLDKYLRPRKYRLTRT